MKTKATILTILIIIVFVLIGMLVDAPEAQAQDDNGYPVETPEPTDDQGYPVETPDPAITKETMMKQDLIKAPAYDLEEPSVIVTISPKISRYLYRVRVWFKLFSRSPLLFR